MEGADAERRQWSLFNKGLVSTLDSIVTRLEVKMAETLC